MAKGTQNDDHTDAMTEALSVGEKDNNDHNEEILCRVMTDHLDIMLAIIMKIREDPEYASHMYSDCPRLQHLLDQHPDLRPVFEDPKFVQINFEQVYRKAGGVLPEDKPNYLRIILKKIVTHPLFKVFKVLLFIKKIVSCIFGGGLSMITSLFSPGAAAAGAAAASANGVDGAMNNEVPNDGNPANQANRESLLQAAEYMEQPEVQDKMQHLLESNPENLDEAIEQDPELKALRDSNPLCAELMKDPETMKILTEPDNLRALADCPDLIEADFNDPNWTPPEIQQVTFDDAQPQQQAIGTETTTTDGSSQVILPTDESMHFETLEGEGEDDGNFFSNQLEGFEVEGGDDGGQSSMKKLPSGRSVSSIRSNLSSKGGNVFASFKDYVASEIVGNGMDDALGLGDAAADVDTSAIEDQVTDVADAAEENASKLESVADMAGNVEDTMDKIEETAEDKVGDDNNRAAVVATSTLAGGAAGAAAATAVSNDDEEGDDQTAGSSVRSSVKSGMGSIFSSFHAAAKEHLATTLLGDDLGEHLIEKMEEREEEKAEDESSDVQEKRSSMRRLGSIL